MKGFKPRHLLELALISAVMIVLSLMIIFGYLTVTYSISNGGATITQTWNNVVISGSSDVVGIVTGCLD